MKAGIITHYNVHNHGAHLQLYALTKTLQGLGYDAQALQYTKNFDFLDLGASNKYHISLKSVPIYAKYLLQNGAARTLYNYNKRNLLSNFRKKYHLIGDYYSHATSLDVAVIGSDEIFSIEPGLNPCFWGMGVPCPWCISYAASFGPTTIDFIEQHNASSFVRGGIDNINMISVRDKNSQDIIQYYGKKTVPIVCDPVLLYPFSEELAHLRRSNTRQCQKSEKYCIVYSYDYNMNDKVTVTAIQRYAQKHKLKTYSIGYFHNWCDKNIQTEPIELLNWFENAEIVFTDTFHGSVISLLVGTQFIAQVKGNSNKLNHLLEMYGVYHRRVNDFSEIEDSSLYPIDYDKVNKTISKVRTESLKFLTSALDISHRS